MERKAKLGWSALRIIGLIYTPLGAVFLIAAGVIVFFAPDMMPLWLTFSLLGGVFFLLGVVFLAVEQHKKKKMDALLEAGRFVWAQVEDCLCNYSVRINSRHPYQLIAVYTDGRGTRHVFKSQSLMIPAPRSLVGQSVRVYTDGDFKNYYVDAQPLLGNYIEH